MDNYIRKICPYCKTEIKEWEPIRVCPACSIPHHEGCWEENKGCTTFGCAEQHDQTQGTNPSNVCSNCGMALGDGQAFCHICGTPNILHQTNCGKCGAPLAEGQEFCAKCGQKVGLEINTSVNNAIEQYNQQISKPKKKKAPIIISIILVVCLLAGGGYYGVRAKQKQDLHDTLQSFNWWTYDEGVKLYLDFSEDEIEYSGYFGDYLGTVKLADLEYKVIDKDTINVEGKEIEVDFGDGLVTFTPSFVNSDSFSLWLN